MAPYRGHEWFQVASVLKLLIGFNGTSEQARERTGSDGGLVTGSVRGRVNDSVALANDCSISGLQSDHDACSSCH